MNYCTQCGAPVALQIPPGDQRERYVCTVCQHIHYENPRLVVGCIAEWEGRILLCRRAIEPQYGRWTLPAGFMENGESTADAAVRETREEAGAEVVLGPLHTLSNVAHIHQVHLFYRARLKDGHFTAGEESLECALFAEEEIPWEALAFRTVSLALRTYFSDRLAGQFALHCVDLEPLPQR